MNITIPIDAFVLMQANGIAVLNSISFDRNELESKLADRIANGESFPNEHIKQLQIKAYWNWESEPNGLPKVTAYFQPTREGVHWLNESLAYRIEETEKGFLLFNQFGYVGTYSTLQDAIKANEESNEPSN